MCSVKQRKGVTLTGSCGTIQPRYLITTEIAFCHIQCLNLFSSDEPVITHGLTLTSKVRFRDVVQVIRVRNTLIKTLLLQQDLKDKIYDSSTSFGNTVEPR